MQRGYLIMSDSYLEQSLDAWLHQFPEIPVPVKEYKFHPKRRWRFDRAWPDHSVAVEIEGVIYKDGGRHQRVAGFLADAEKYEAALRLGWRVYKVPGQWIAEGRRAIWRPQVMETLRELLKGGDGCTKENVGPVSI